MIVPTGRPDRPRDDGVSLAAMVTKRTQPFRRRRHPDPLAGIGRRAAPLPWLESIRPLPPAAGGGTRRADQTAGAQGGIRR
ncbi:hypothetical protein GCM10009759_67930 [Kitasatospora saccharophila]|uniref:Uncharacterized protein n=1 Tax=Kitasatospora saccharophila TaxID=407973 RepID=A0ABP5JSS7_9ACTN